MSCRTSAPRDQLALEIRADRASYENGAGGYRGTEARQPARRWPFGWDSGKSAQASPNAQSLIEECLCHD